MSGCSTSSSSSGLTIDMFYLIDIPDTTAEIRSEKDQEEQEEEEEDTWPGAKRTNTILWPCLVFKNETHLSQCWPHAIAAVKDWTDRQRRFWRTQLDGQYTQHMLSSTTTSTNPSLDPVALLLGTQDPRAFYRPQNLQRPPPATIHNLSKPGSRLEQALATFSELLRQVASGNRATSAAPIVVNATPSKKRAYSSAVPSPTDPIQELEQQQQQQQDEQNAAKRRRVLTFDDAGRSVTTPIHIASHSREDTNEDISSKTPTTVASCTISPTSTGFNNTSAVAATNEEADQALQQLLQRARFVFTLLPHQHAAVRRIAGVPDQFPLHAATQVTNVAQAVEGLPAPSTKGLVVADAMGLGKTVEAIAGAVIANAVANSQSKDRRPTLIVAPNDVVLDQWRDTLLKNGVHTNRIVMFRRRDGHHNKEFRGTNHFVLLTRYTVQGEMRDMFERCSLHGDLARRRSRLFPHVHDHLVQSLHHEYLSAKGTGVSGKGPHDSRDDYITKLLRQSTGNKPVFRMLIVDEAHFLKNRLTYWTMGIGLISLYSERVVPLTGTPYNNNLGDLGTLMTLIDPNEGSALTRWWEQRVQPGDKSIVLKDSTDSLSWHQHYMLRRTKKTIEHLLPAKLVKQTQVLMRASELSVYLNYEQQLRDVLREFAEELSLNNDHYRLKIMFRVLMAVLSLMRMSIIHPMLPSNGREVTKLFSPSRSRLLSSKECPAKCVCCVPALCPSILSDQAEHAPTQAASFVKPECNTNEKAVTIDKMEEGETYNDDQEEVFHSDDRPVYPLSKQVCCATPPVIHYAHSDCEQDLIAQQAESGNRVACPRCLDLKKRATESMSTENDARYWCQGVVERYPMGFVGSPKINAVVDWATTKVPEDEKMLIVSFFKGSLDLLEAILLHEYKWEIARFDGDVNTIVKNEQLKKFKTRPRCRVLLMTVQSGGVGLNICEASRVAFLDRWFNPFVHEQAEDRCHRLGQERKVHVSYFDAAGTLDEAMFEINKLKQQNSDVLLSNGLEIGSSGGSFSYKELSGLMTRLISSIQQHRSRFLSVPENQTLPIPPIPIAEMQQCIESHQHRKSWRNGTSGPRESDDTNPAPDGASSTVRS